MYAVRWVNPRPDEPIRAVDLVGAKSSAIPVLISVTGQGAKQTRGTGVPPGFAACGLAKKHFLKPFSLRSRKAQAADAGGTPVPRGHSLTVVSYRTPSGTGTGTATVTPWSPVVLVIESTATKAV